METSSSRRPPPPFPAICFFLFWRKFCLPYASLKILAIFCCAFSAKAFPAMGSLNSTLLLPWDRAGERAEPESQKAISTAKQVAVARFAIRDSRDPQTPTRDSPLRSSDITFFFFFLFFCSMLQAQSSSSATSPSSCGSFFRKQQEVHFSVQFNFARHLKRFRRFQAIVLLANLPTSEFVQKPETDWAEESTIIFLSTILCRMWNWKWIKIKFIKKTICKQNTMNCSGLWSFCSEVLSFRTD